MNDLQHAKDIFDQLENAAESAEAPFSNEALVWEAAQELYLKIEDALEAADNLIIIIEDDINGPTDRNPSVS